MRPRRLGPKRASKIRKLFKLDKEDDVRSYVIRQEGRPRANGKVYSKAPKIQRLITPQRLQRKRKIKAIKRKRHEKSKAEAVAYSILLAEMHEEEKDKRNRRRSSRRSTANRGGD
eukprot:TRINITY_DN16204_c0_g1_i1.p1 TRINITY_DN16204_c0_g1~~TRINITY_DN16204_c0_g1_i1.p1  ORF type:complete len:115 (+),score=19.85 TRINITY_DN16204_c0_g1_i1:369-713(+)